MKKLKFCVKCLTEGIRNSKTKKCMYCREYFCDRHLKPEPSTKRNDYGDIITLGHRCLPYEEYRKEREKESTTKAMKSLDEMKKVLIKKPIFKHPELPLIKPTFSLTRLIRKLQYELRLSLYSFLKYTMIILIILTLLNLFLIGRFGLLTLILRSVGLVFFYYIIALLYRKTKYKVPWKWIIIAILVVMLGHIFSTGDYSTIKIFDKITGIEKFTDTLALSFFNFMKSPETIFKPQAEVGVGKIILREKTPQEALNDRIQELKNKSSQLEKEIHNLVNQKRTQQGLVNLEFDEKLSEIARYHSKDMAIRNYFEHVNPEGEDVDTRYKKFSYNCMISFGNYIYSGAENIMLNNIISSYYYDPLTGYIQEYIFKSFDELSSSTVNGWMNSKGHRENILTPFWRKEGIGIYIDVDGEVYITQNFC